MTSIPLHRDERREVAICSHTSPGIKDKVSAAGKEKVGMVEDGLLCRNQHPLPCLPRFLSGARRTAYAIRYSAVRTWRIFVTAYLIGDGCKPTWSACRSSCDRRWRGQDTTLGGRLTFRIRHWSH